MKSGNLSSGGEEHLTRSALMPDLPPKRVIIIAGPNGAGKSTLAQEFLPHEAGGYAVHLVFLRLHDADLAVARVATRVAQGGHHVSEEVIRRRFDQGWANFQNIYRTLADSWRLYDNSGDQALLIDQGIKA